MSADVAICDFLDCAKLCAANFSEFLRSGVMDLELAGGFMKLVLKCLGVIMGWMVNGSGRGGVRPFEGNLQNAVHGYFFGGDDLEG